jgi:DNA-binding HxlR family transcriptional regulator
MPPHVEYSLTRMGLEVAHEVQSLADWIEGNLYRILKQRRDSEAESVAA